MDRLVRLRLMLAVIVALSLLLSVAWFLRKRNNRPASGVMDAPLSEEHAVVPIDLPWTKTIRAADVDTDRWQSERLASDSEKLLRQLLQSLGTVGEAVDLTALVDPDFRCGELRPAPLNEVFQQEALVVRRAELRAGTSLDQIGIAGLQASLDALKRPLAGIAEPRTALKTIRVTVDERKATTTHLVQIDGRGDRGAVQLSAVWQCDWQLDEQRASPRLASLRVENYHEATYQGRALFRDATAAVCAGLPAYRQQLVFGTDHWRSHLQDRVVGGIDGFHGIAVGDVNGDHLDDIYLCQSGGVPNRLFLHQVDGSVIDASHEAGIDWLEDTTSALLIDCDNDGHQDLIASMNRGLVFHRGDGRGKFRPVATHALVGGTKSMAAADYDGDGDLDIYVCRYSAGGRRPEHDTSVHPFPFNDARNGAANLLLRNDGRWRFTDATTQLGLGENNDRYSFSAAWEDYDNDGDFDLYVANDFGRNNLYRNDAGHFRDVAAAAAVEDRGPGMSTAWGDYDNDGRLDLYVSNMFSAAGNRVSHQTRFQHGAGDSTRHFLQRFARGNTLFHNLDGHRFRDVSQEANVTMGRWAWASLFADLNNDGWQDLLVANGMITGSEPDDL